MGFSSSLSNSAELDEHCSYLQAAVQQTFKFAGKASLKPQTFQRVPMESLFSDGLSI